MCKIVIFGTGGLAEFLVKYVKKDVTIVGYCDSYDYAERKINGIPVVSVDSLRELNYDYIVIAFSDVEQGKKILIEQGVDAKKIVGYHFNFAYNYDKNPYQIKCDKLLQDELSTKEIENLFELPEKKYYLCSTNVPEKREIIEQDFVREQTLAFLASEIKRKNIVGNIAELGVFKGEFAKKMNKVFPDRVLYLFDTFEGYVEKDIQNDKTVSWGSKHKCFEDTTVDDVLEIMPYKDCCVIKKGYFPDTFDLVNEQFAFVSLDANLYNPMKMGLELFYPRLSKGGYIMVHDYNNIIREGTKRAVQDYCDENNISFVPIPDMAGSIVITK